MLYMKTSWAIPSRNEEIEITRFQSPNWAA